MAGVSRAQPHKSYSSSSLFSILSNRVEFFGEEMEFWGLLVVALMPVLKTLLITALGSFLALDSVQLLSPTSRHHLNNIAFYVFTPCLVGGYLASTITLQGLVTLWFMPLNILVTFVIGSTLAWILNKIARTPRHLRGLVIGCCSAGNLGNLLLIILPEVCKESDSLFGDSTTCTANAKTYTSLSMSVASIYIWCYTYPIMHVYTNRDADKNIISTKVLGDAEASLARGDETEISHCVSLEKEKVKNRGKIMQGFMNVTKKVNFKMVFAPCTIGAIIGFIVGIASPIRKAMIGDKAPLRVIENSISLLGEAAVPVMTLIVGANLLKGLKKSGLGIPLIIGIIAVRYIAMPVIGVVIVKAASHYGMIGSDLLYHFVLMLQYAVPPAMAIGMITQLFDAGQSECSVIMLWTYAVAAVSLTLWSTFFMWIVNY